MSEDEWIASLPETVDLRGLLTSLERRLIQRALNATSGAQAEVARRLGLSRSDLGYKLSKHEIKVAGEWPLSLDLHSGRRPRWRYQRPEPLKVPPSP